MAGALLGLRPVDRGRVRDSVCELRGDRRIRPGHRRRRRASGSSFGLVWFCSWSGLRSSGGSGFGAWPAVPAAGATDTPSSFRSRPGSRASPRSGRHRQPARPMDCWAERSEPAHISTFEPAPPSPSWPASFTGTTGRCSDRSGTLPIRIVEYRVFSGRAHRRGRGGGDAGGDPRRQSLRERDRRRQRFPPGRGCAGGPDPVGVDSVAILGQGDAVGGRSGRENVGSSPGDDLDSAGRLLPGGRRCADRRSLCLAPGRPRRRCLTDRARI